MKDIDADIKKALQINFQKIEDDSFTKRIVDGHLGRKPKNISKPFFNLLPLIIGISSSLASIGLMVIINQNSSLISGIEITEQHGMILAVLSIMFLLYNFAEEFIKSSNGDRLLKKNLSL